MSAKVMTEFLYYAFCDSCADGSEILSEDDATEWVDQHNEESHS